MFYMANSFGADVGLKQHDFNIFCGRLFKESDEFSQFERSNLIDYRVLNDGSIDDSVNKLIRIINKDKGKENV